MNKSAIAPKLEDSTFFGWISIHTKVCRWSHSCLETDWWTLCGGLCYASWPLWWQLVIVVARSTLRRKDQLDSDKTNTECTALLRWHLRPVVMLLMHRNNRFVFQQDDAWSHTACLSMIFLQANNINTLPWPSRAPDLAHIEHVLYMVNRHIRENHPPFNSLQELENAPIIEWNAIPQYKF